MTCAHNRTRNVYRRASDRSWSKLQVRQCRDCGAVLGSQNPEVAKTPEATKPLNQPGEGSA